ncbi:DUF3954 domain-containing protein [Terribacillus saccharophilus]|uniref:DUF3954 domain-containing protein n=1 Tax=Terribacillus saccharophilus TaxID=361277 RepID=UPI002DC488A5|nr:DUF3954 domain-containing protein [Terribacillus saccharophilus]MEC0288933.1 DUF3954 domain-containing protein [Terribacillus saccharophilus]
MNHYKETVEIDLNKDAVYIVSNNKLKQLDKPKSGYGKQIIPWQDHKIGTAEVSYTIK